MTNLYTTLFSAAGDILKELQPNTWDTMGLDVMKSYVQRWQLTEKLEAESLTIQDVWRDAILDEKLINSARYKAYVKSGGMYKPDVTAPEAEEAGTAQASDFVMSGHVVGEKICLETTQGSVNTTTERILSFTKFQQDVLRDTLTVYPSSLRKKHETNVAEWVSRLVKLEKASSDETLPQNVLASFMEEFFHDAETEPSRHERTLRLKSGAILVDGVYYFQLGTLLLMMKRYDKDYRWTRSELKLILKSIYGRSLQTTSTVFRVYRCFSIVEKAVSAQTQVFNDSGSRQDDPADHGRDGGDEAGQGPTVLPDPLILKGNGGGGEDAPTQNPALPDGRGVVSPVE